MMQRHEKVVLLFPFNFEVREMQQEIPHGMAEMQER